MSISHFHMWVANSNDLENPVVVDIFPLIQISDNNYVNNKEPVVINQEKLVAASRGQQNVEP